MSHSEYARFSAEQAMEASLDGDPILVPQTWVSRQCDLHSVDASEFFLEYSGKWLRGEEVDAGKLFMWLGY